MEPRVTILLVVLSALVLVLPRRWATLPLVVATCYVTRGQDIEVGPANLTVLRLLVIVGLIRLLIRHERIAGRLVSLDLVMAGWGLWMIVSSAFHVDPNAQLITNLGRVGDGWGLYVLARGLCHTIADIERLCLFFAASLLPIAIGMLVEKATVHNVFASLGGIREAPSIRDGKVRAQGPFAHAILAGTVAAVCIPLMWGLWFRRPRWAVAGVLACGAMIFASTSSGPIMSALVSVFAVLMWRWRHRLVQLRWAAVAAYVALDIVMNDPAYYVMARIDLTGSSSGWHRARIIETAIEHLTEWWLVGTDYTRHWMVTGVSWSPDHADITNHYVYLGVIGGIPQILLFLSLLWIAFGYIGTALSVYARARNKEQYIVWAVGAALFSHMVTFVSVAYFDQSIVFFYFVLAAAGSLGAVAAEHAAALERPGSKAAGVSTGWRFRRPVNSTVDRRFGLAPEGSARSFERFGNRYRRSAPSKRQVSERIQ